MNTKRLLLFGLSLVLSVALFGEGEALAVHAEPTKAAFDFDKPPDTRFEIAPNLTFGARVELEYEFEGNFDLDSEDPDDLSALSPSVSFAFNYAPTERVSFFLDIEPSYTFYDDEERKKKNDESVELKQAYVSFDEYLKGLSIRAGRQRFVDRREWVYDDELDGVRLFYAYSKFALDASVTVKNDKDLMEGGGDEDTTNFFVMGMYSPVEDAELAAYVMARNDRSSANEDPVFFGLSVVGETDEFDYWLEAAHVRGEVGRRETVLVPDPDEPDELIAVEVGPRKIRGFGLDLGGTYTFEDIDYEPSISFGYALGSGDSDPADDVDEDFRQTGLHENSAKFNGITKLKYYGEMFDPELSNMHIFTVGAGVRPTKNTSVDLVYHFYYQHKASDEIRDAKVDRDPDGLDKELGSEIDLVMGFRAKPHWKGSVTVGYFIPGEAFPDDSDNALFSEIKVRYDF